MLSFNYHACQVYFHSQSCYIPGLRELTLVESPDS